MNSLGRWYLNEDLKVQDRKPCGYPGDFFAVE